MIFFLLLILGADAFIPISITIGRGAFLSKLLGLERKEREAGSTTPKTLGRPEKMKEIVEKPGEETKEVVEGNNGTTPSSTVEPVEEVEDGDDDDGEEAVVEVVDVNTLPATTEGPTDPVEPEELIEKEENSLKVNLTTPSSLLGSLKATTEEISRNNSTKCQDQFSQCYGVRHLCKDKLYEKIMIRSCAKTCGFCQRFVSLPMGERCRDTYPEDCAHWGHNGFCHAYFYTMPEKVEHCMKTCNLC